MVRRKPTQDKMLDVALEVFAEKGYHGATVSDIHQRAGAGRGTFYSLFPSKDEVFERVIDRTLAPARRVLLMKPEFVAAMVPKNFQARSFDILASIVDAALSNRAGAALVLREAQVAGPRFAERVDSFFVEAVGFLGKVIDILKTEGWLAPDVNARSMAVIIIGTVKEVIIQELLAPTDGSAQTIIPELARVALEGAAGEKLRDAWD